MGLNILMGIHVLPALHCYWSSNEYLGVDAVKKVMTKARFVKLTQYLHLCNNEDAAAFGEPGYNPLFKVQPLLDIVKKSFSAGYKPQRDLSIDEAMVAFKGRSHLKQYLPAKPIKWGFKIWTIAESSTGYVSDFDIYTGKRDRPSAHGLGYDVVMKLSTQYQHQNRHLYFDNFFSSVKLLDDLLLREVYACATIRKNRAMLPQKIKAPGRLQRGQGNMVQKGNIVCVVWHDKRDVRVISTNSQPRFTTVPRRNRGHVEEVPCPESVLHYNKHLGSI